MPAFGECELPHQTLISTHLFVPREQENCGFLKRVDEMVTSVARMARSRVPVMLSIGNEGSAASFDVGMTLEIYQRFMLSTEYGQTRYRTVVDNMAVIAHEYGHALFAEALSARFSAYRDFFLPMREFSRERMRLLMDGGTPEQLADVQSRQRVHQASPENRGLFRESAPYQELYADVVAVYDQGYPEAITSALYRDDLGDQEMNGVFARSFTPSSTFHIHRYNSTEEHTFYWRVRRFIGEKLWPTSPAQKETYLALVTEALLDDLEALREGKLPATPEGRNDALIARLQAALDRSGGEAPVPEYGLPVLLGLTQSQ